MHTVIAGMDGGRGRRGCPKRQWIDDVKRWTGMSVVLCARVAVDRCELRRRVKSAVWCYWWCGRVVKTQCYETCEVFCPWFEPHRRNNFTTSQQSTQLSILPRSVIEYSEVALRAQALDKH